MLTRCTNKRVDVAKIHSFQGLPSQNGVYSEAWNVRSFVQETLSSHACRMESPLEYNFAERIPGSDVFEHWFNDSSFEWRVENELPRSHFPSVPPSIRETRPAFEKLRDSLKNSMPLRTSNKASPLLCQVFSSFLISFARIHPRAGWPALVSCSGTTTSLQLSIALLPGFVYLARFSEFSFDERRWICFHWTWS